jgi:hypothetical protein
MSSLIILLHFYGDTTLSLATHARWVHGVNASVMTQASQLLVSLSAISVSELATAGKN